MPLYIETPVLRMITLLFSIIYLSKADINIITKEQWEGKVAKNELIPIGEPVIKVVICHTASRSCNTKEACSKQLRIIQEFQMEVKSFDDIGYNFLIGNDGNVYEGRGWDYQGAFAKGLNAKTLAFAFIGTFTTTSPTTEALEAAQELIHKGVQLNKIASDYKLLGHRQLIATESPGDELYEIIKQWPHWQSEP